MEKHPDQSIPDPEAFISCNELPLLIDVDVSSDHVKKFAHSLSGSAVVSAIDALQWQDLLLKHGGASERLREAIASLTRRLAKYLVLWDDIWVLKAKN